MFPLESMGETGENVAEQEKVSREDQDAFALAVAAALGGGGRGGALRRRARPGRRARARRASAAGHDAEKLAALKPAFREDGTVTAGNSSGINDGAAALVIASEETAQELGVEPLGAFVGVRGRRGRPARDGDRAGPGRAEAARARRRRRSADLDLVELNEAFASQSLAVIRELGLDPEKVNVNGGAIALGHPLGMSGARLVVTLLHELRRRGGRYGLATMCVGVGQGQAALFERAASDGAHAEDVHPPRAAARAARRRARRRLLRAAGAEGAGRRRAARRAGRARRGRRRAARRARGRLAARPGRGSAHLRRRARRRGALVLRRGGALLRRAPAARRHRELRGGPRASSRSSCPATGRSASATRTGGRSRSCRPRSVVPAMPGRRRHCCAPRPRSSSTCRRGRGSTSRRSATSRGGRSTTTSASLRSRVVVNLDVAGHCRRPRRARRPRGLPRPPHGARGQGAAASSATAGELEESIQMVPTPAALLQEGLAETGPSVVLDDDAGDALARARAARPRRTTSSGRARDAEARRPLRRIGARRGADDPRGRRVGRGGRGVPDALGAASRPSGRSTRSASSPIRRGAPT